jgi:diacylglycerol kinase (ATP)
VQAQRIVAIVNPRAGRRRAGATLRAVRAQLERSAALEVLETERAGHARELARELDLERCLGVCAVGGDGTLFEVLGGIFERADGARPTLGVIPAGSGHSLALDLGVARAEDAARCIAAGARRAIDVARVELDGRVLHSVNVLAWGAGARINARAERLRWAAGARYDLAAVLELLRPRLGHAGARLDGECGEHLLLGTASITRHAGRGMRVAPDAVLDDGLIDIVTIARGARLALARMLASVRSGAHVASPLSPSTRSRTSSAWASSGVRGPTPPGASRRAQAAASPALARSWKRPPLAASSRIRSAAAKRAAAPPRSRTSSAWWISSSRPRTPTRPRASP